MQRTGKQTGPNLTSSYDRDTWEFRVTVDGRAYTFRNVSPFIADQFHKRAKRNRGRALAYLRGIGKKGGEA